MSDPRAKGDDMSRMKMKLMVVAGVLAALGAGAWSPAAALSKQGWYLACRQNATTTGYEEQCCKTAGGTWTVQTYDDGVVVYTCRDIPAGDMEFKSTSAPSPTPTPMQTSRTATSGT